MTQESHDLQRHIGSLLECLSSGKRPIGLFLGAGCPMAIQDHEGAPLIPGVKGLTEQVLERIAKIDKLRGSSLTVIGNLKEDGITSPNVEEILGHIRGLHAVAGAGEARGLTTAVLRELDDGICEVIHDVVSPALPSMDTPYHHVARWADGIARTDPVEVFTTNYDLLLEQALEESRVPYFDGFAGSRRPFFSVRAMEEDRIPLRWVRLWKLHGSVNWYQRESYGVFRSSGGKPDGLRRVIHPSHLKYEESRRMPYLAMIDRLRAFLRQPSAALVIIGYSFRDQHLNEVISQGLQSTQSAIGFSLLRSDLERYKEARTISSERSNLCLLAKDAGVVGTSEAPWRELGIGGIPSSMSDWIAWASEPATH